MSRPLVISDCDEVLLEMIGPYRTWLKAEHGINFDFKGGDFAASMSNVLSGEMVSHAEIWRLLDLFFDTQMHTQSPIAGAMEAMAKLRHDADVVILTNLGDHRREDRTRQLAAFGLDVPVYTNTGPKGPALARILEEYNPSAAVFIDDLPQHHHSVSTVAPQVGRLHLCGEIEIAPYIACAHQAGHAHARIDEWHNALPWLQERLGIV